MATLLNTRDLIQSDSRFNYRLAGPFDGSGQPMVDLRDLNPERYVPQFGQELAAWKLTAPDGQVFLVPDQDVSVIGGALSEDAYANPPIQIYVGEDSTRRVSYLISQDTPT